MSRNPKPHVHRAPAEAWTEAHEREADARLYEIAARLLREKQERAHQVARATYGEQTQKEEHFRAALLYAGLAPAEIDREVRRTRARAEGRVSPDVITTERLFCIRFADGTYEGIDEEGVERIDGRTTNPSEAWTTDDRGTVKDVADQAVAEYGVDGRVVPIRRTITRRRILRAPAPQPTDARDRVIAFDHGLYYEQSIDGRVSLTALQSHGRLTLAEAKHLLPWTKKAPRIDGKRTDRIRIVRLVPAPRPAKKGGR